jgi:uncharacterized protein YPO0396
VTTTDYPTLLEPDVPEPVATGPTAETVENAGLLFHVDGATEGTLQWKAETFQVVNWGGFEGRVRFEFHPGSTLISGASGSGKSTLLDAYIALMMRSDTPFNGASNDAAGGRARGAEQRNLLSYLRGQTDTTTDSDGHERAKVLRGERAATWGAVGMTFVDDHGRRFTALRVYYVPARARSASDITMRMATYDGVLDLADLAGTVESIFAPKALKAAFPGLRTHDSYAGFANTLYTRLGIGANGDGDKALRLLVRIQSGHQIRTVDDLYKEMVLERPATYAAADRAIEHFDDLEAAYTAMLTEQQKADLLGPITDLHARLLAARAETDALDTFGLTHDGDTPLTVWSLRTEAALLDTEVDALLAERAQTTDNLTRARGDVTDLQQQLETARETHRAQGGDALQRLGDDIEIEEQRREQRLTRRSLLAERITALGSPLATRDQFDRLQADAATFLADSDTVTADLEQRRDALLRQQYPLLDRKRELTDERASFAGRTGRVPKPLDDIRRQAAAAAGIDVRDLPFLAELIDIAPEHARWRTAVESVLGGSARLLLVPLERLEQFSVAVDDLQIRGKLNFEGVPSAEHRALAGDPDRIAGKLLFQDSPYSSWVHRHVSDPARNALCVEDPRDLAGPGYRVTLAGQTRYGTRGSIGRTQTGNIIGFSSAEAIAEIDEQLADLDQRLAHLDEQRRALDDERRTVERRRTAYEAVQTALWDDIDVPGSEERIATLEADRRTILEANDTLQALQNHIDHLGQRLEAAQQHRFDLQSQLKQSNERHGSLCERQDDVNRELDRIDDEQRVVLEPDQVARLDVEFAAAAAPGDPANLADYPANLARLRQRLHTAIAAARDEAARTEGDLARIFDAYQLKWEDPNLGRDAAAYPDYARVLDNIVSSGLHTKRDEWRRRLTQWSGQDLVPLSGAMDAAIEDIEDRLEPINHILATLPFGAGRDRLQMKLRRLTPEHVTQFRRDLRTLSSAATKGVDDAQMERRFLELQQFMAQLRRRDDPRANGEATDRDRLLDVRRHVDITAERYDANGQRQSVYTVLGGKSGGESQELVAFIVGAALRFRLGDELRARPRFAPVFLDEGFVKSDAEFTGRAVQAWKGLGFQLIVGAPLDKVTALEPHMDELLAITKDTRSGYSFVEPITDPTRRGGGV